MKRLLRQIEREVLYSEWFLDTQNRSIARGHLLSLAALNHTQACVSPPHYGYKAMASGKPPRVDKPQRIVNEKAGICGSAYILFSQLVNDLGMPCRAVQFYYDGNATHIAGEVHYDGIWHFYDPTWGAYFKKDCAVLSVDDARRLPERETYLIQNKAMLWYRILGDLDILHTLSRPDLRIIYGEQNGA